MIAACSPGADAEERSRVGRASEGVPLFVEELLASPGIPESISETVRERLAEFPDRERAVLEAAAVLGHHFDWEILPAASGQPPRWCPGPWPGRSTAFWSPLTGRGSSSGTPLPGRRC